MFFYSNVEDFITEGKFLTFNLSKIMKFEAILLILLTKLQIFWLIIELENFK